MEARPRRLRHTTRCAGQGEGEGEARRGEGQGGAGLRERKSPWAGGRGARGWSGRAAGEPAWASGRAALSLVGGMGSGRGDAAGGGGGADVPKQGSEGTGGVVSQPRRERLEFGATDLPLPPSLLLQGAPTPSERPSIGPVGESPLLARLQAFLPEMERQNAQLEAAIAAHPEGNAAFDIENLGGKAAQGTGGTGIRVTCGSEGEGSSDDGSDSDSDEDDEPEHIEMDIQPGVLELRSAAALAAAERAMAAGGGAVVDAEDDSDSSDDEGGGGGGSESDTKGASKRNAGITEL